MQKAKRPRNKIEDSYTVVAKLFTCTPNYVRQVVADTKHQRHKGKKTIAIRQAYLAYKYGKEKLIKKIQNDLKPAA